MTRHAEDWTWSRHALHRVVLLGLMVVVLCAPSADAAAGSASPPNAPTCSTARPGATGQPLPSTTVATIEEAYTCLLAHYPTGPILDDRLLLHGAMAGLITELLQLGADQPTAVLPALGGNPTADWQAFRRTYLTIAARLPRDERIQQGLAQATIAGLVTSLQDDHTRYAAPLLGVSGKAAGTSSGPAGVWPRSASFRRPRAAQSGHRTPVHHRHRRRQPRCARRPAAGRRDRRDRRASAIRPGPGGPECAGAA
jgi:carboxyl-terminal processing protease